jgi:Ca2+-binding RTX toxin-like protein
MMRKTILVLASVALAMVVAGGVAWAANIQCPTAGFGRLASGPESDPVMVKTALCNGTEKADTMQGTNKYPDDMTGKSGADTMYGRDNRLADDEMFGGLGPDKMYGGRGRDTLLGGGGVDRLYGQDGADHLRFGTFTLSRRIDRTDDYYYGGEGEDVFSVGGTNGVDRVYGGTGDDDISVGGNAATGAKEIVDCGPGTDTVGYDEGVDIIDDTCEEQRPF